MNDIDPHVQALVKAIGTQESGGNYDAKGASGEFGAYQFMPSTWKSWAGQYLGDSNAEPSVANQNKVAYSKVSDLKKQGLNPAQIAAVWNAGEGSLKNDSWKTNVGTNSFGVKYDTPSYVKNVSKYYSQFAPTETSQPDQPHLTTLANGQQVDFGSVPKAQDPYNPTDTPISGAVKGIAQGITDIPTSIGGGVLNAISAGGRALGINSQASPTVPSLLTGAPVDPVGYRGGQELGPVDTAIQGVGRGLQGAGLAAAPEIFGGSPLLTNTLIGGVSGLGQGLEEGKGALDTTKDTAMGSVLGLGTGGLIKGLGKISPATDEAFNQEILSQFNKAVKPTVVGKGTSGLANQYDQKAVDALHTIAGNKENLKFNTSGVEETGRTPQTLGELSDAITQTKGDIYKQYNNLAKEATGQGASVDVAKIADELNKVVNDKALAISNPSSVEYAKGLQDRLIKAGTIDADTAEQVIQHYNNSLQSFYKNPTYDAASRVAIDAMVANRFRSELDTAIESATGKEYQALKNTYGSLKAIEKDVSKRNIVNSRKQPAGLIDYADIFSAGDLTSAITSMNPALLAKAAAQKGFKEYLKHLNNPDTAIKSIFSKIEGRTSIPKDLPTASVTPPTPAVKMNAGYANPGVLAKIGLGGTGLLAGASKLSKSGVLQGHETYQADTNPSPKPETNIAKGIAHAETRGESEPYTFSQWSNKALGPGSPLGKALGKYQITEARLREKANDFIGKQVTPQEFLHSPSLQEKFIQSEISWLESQGLNEEQIYATHRYGWGHLKPEEIADAVKRAHGYIKSAKG